MAKAVKGGSTLRSDQASATRRRIVEAATAVFIEQGFTGARIEDIAEQAGVAVPTVYKAFTNKRTVLAAAVTSAMTAADDGAGVRVDEQAWWLEQLAAPDPERQLELIARNARRIYERAGALLEVVRAAARLEPELAALWDDIAAQRLDRSQRSARALLTKAKRRARLSRSDTAITLLALTAPELFTSHLAAGRSPAGYERWLTHVLRTSLLRDR